MKEFWYKKKLRLKNKWEIMKNVIFFCTSSCQGSGKTLTITLISLNIKLVIKVFIISEYKL
jgi:hypothetical protein